MAERPSSQAPRRSFHEDSFGLVVEGVGGEDVGGLPTEERGAEGFVAEVAGGLFEGFVVGCGAGAGVDAAGVEGDAQAVAKGLDKALVGFGLFSAQRAG